MDINPGTIRYGGYKKESRQITGQEIRIYGRHL
jgi:hypothetical protein